MEQGDLRQYTRAIRRRWWLPALLVIIAMIGAFYRFGGAAQSYRTTTTLMVTSSPFAPPSSDVTPGVEAFRSGAVSVLNNIVELIGTRAIAGRVAAALKSPDVAEIQGSVTASNPRGTDIIRISATSGNPQRAAAIANATADELTAYFQQINRADAREARRFVEQQLAAVRAQLDASDRAVLGTRQDLSRVEGAASSIISSYYDSLASLDQARAAQREVNARLAAARSRLGREPTTALSEVATVNNPAYQQVQGALTLLEIEQTKLAEIYTPAHHKMQEIAAQVAAMRERLATVGEQTVGQEVRTVNPVYARLVQDVVGLEVERAAVGARIAALQGMVGSRRAAASALATGQFATSRVARENQILDGRYRLLSERYQEAVLRENVAGFLPVGLQVVERAPAAAAPVPSTAPLTAAAAGLIGLVLGIMGAIFLESGDDRIRTPEDVERALGVPVLAEVPNANEPRVAPATTMFTVIFLIVVGVSLLGAFVRTPLVPLTLAGRVMRTIVISPIETGAAQVRHWATQSIFPAQGTATGQ